ncbi:PD-(D/E)XK nuclease family protein [Gimesia fumaroli]|uniref:ASCH domain protein n=1 Tax=Gimesia fumaroli TaxID=2527976 RepID=A0A518I8Y3_9PLAN|nr:hypothetical protein [Gimesia fumaroli]QDV49576.1 hypothetical protein Enr17x_15960 [Gimesia fumaroli]
MKERGLICHGRSINNIIDGLKTHTRRVAKGFEAYDEIEHLIDRETGEYFWRCWTDAGPYRKYKDVTCPHGQPGDRLWIRETWLELDSDHYVLPGKPKLLMVDCMKYPMRNGISYRAGVDAEGDEIREEYGYKWKSPLFMPKSYSRLTLEIKDVRLERVCNIRPADARKEGYEDINAFFEGWDEINAKRGYSAESNPFVWVIEFERIKD